MFGSSYWKGVFVGFAGLFTVLLFGQILIDDPHCLFCGQDVDAPKEIVWVAVDVHIPGHGAKSHIEPICKDCYKAILAGMFDETAPKEDKQ